MSEKNLGLRARCFALAAYIFIFFLMGWLVSGQVFQEGGKFLFVLSGIGLWSFTCLSSPYFRPPSGSLGGSIASLLLLLTLDLGGVKIGKDELQALKWSAVGLTIVTLVSSILAILFLQRGESQPKWLRALSRFAFRISSEFGRAEVVFTPPALISIFGFYQGDTLGQMWLTLAFAILVTIKPIEKLISIGTELYRLLTDRVESRRVGTIDRIDSPSIVRVSLQSDASWSTGNAYVARLPDATNTLLLPLFEQVHDGKVIGTGYMTPSDSAQSRGLAVGDVALAPSTIDRNDLIKKLSKTNFAVELVGFVVENSEIGSLRFEISGQHSLREGHLVFCNEEDQRVYFQVLNAKTTEESFDENPRGTIIVTAAQLGIWDEKLGFQKFGWLPTMNAPVFTSLSGVSESTAFGEDSEFSLGHIPESQLEVKADINELREFHAAVLGATGTGKTELAFDIIRKAADSGAKVFCVDFTGEYVPRLNDLKPHVISLSADLAQELDSMIFAVESGDFGGQKAKQPLKSFEDTVRQDVENQVRSFLEDSEQCVAIITLDEVTNTRATLRATEYYLSSIFGWARLNRKAKKILIALEEAHTVIPEQNFYSYDKVDTTAVVGRIAQIALQGRKYGVGLLLVSQRTALVSKTVLSQCNTVFCFSLVDQTSLTYLENVFGKEHIQSIPNLGTFQMVAYGKGVLSQRPVIVQIPEDEKKRKASKALDKPAASASDEQVP